MLDYRLKRKNLFHKSLSLQKWICEMSSGRSRQNHQTIFTMTDIIVPAEATPATEPTTAPVAEPVTTAEIAPATETVATEPKTESPAAQV